MAVMIPKLQVAVGTRIEEFEPIARSRTGVLTFSLVMDELRVNFGVHHVGNDAQRQFNPL